MTVLALPALFDAVKARFDDEGTKAENVFGWRTEAQPIPTGHRVAWIPGDPNGALGKIGPAKSPGRNPRPLAALAELFTCVISSHDPKQAEDERAQYEATRLLYDAWFRAAYLGAFQIGGGGFFTIESERWRTEKKERRFGAVLEVVCTISAMIPDKALATAPVDTRGVIDVEELDNTEQFETAPAP